MTETLQTKTLGRRGFLGGSAALAGVAVAGLSASPADAVAGLNVSLYFPTPIPTAEERHIISRCTYGYTRAALAALRAAGGSKAWLNKQLSPGTVIESPNANFDGWWSSITATPDEIIANHSNGSEPAWIAITNYSRWSTLKRIYSNRQVFERVAEFWEEFFHIPSLNDKAFAFRNSFSMKMRELALTSFEELLIASTTHPAMGMYLDNGASHKRAVNENLGRELLELHSVGIGNYNEDDVKNSANMLTGYRIDAWSTWKVYYDTSWHYTGPIKVMGFTHANSSSDGRPATVAYLKYLARHPSTAKRVCYRLAQKFVSDSPSAALVNSLQAVYLANGTRIKPVMQALFASAEFKNSAGAKVKTPPDEVASLYRALGTKMYKPQTNASGANAFIWGANNLGYMPNGWLRPDGPPPTNSAWLTPSRFIASWESNWLASGGWWPNKEIEWLPPAKRLPKSSLKFSQFIDHLSRTLLGESASSGLLKVCCDNTKITPDTTITADHYVIKRYMPHLLTLILNQPSFYRR